MKILVLSDSHSSLHLMRDAVRCIRPNAVVHLGDYFDDGEVLKEENPQLLFYQVPGNCDRYRMQGFQPEILCCSVCGVRLYMTHGHLHMVKSGLYRLLQDAAAEGAQAVLYGHTHAADCRCEKDLWILNPGSCGHGGGSVGLLEVNNGNILSCRVLRQEEWEVIK